MVATETKNNKQAIKEYEAQREDAKVFSTYMILVWISLNAAFLYAISELSGITYCSKSTEPFEGSTTRVCSETLTWGDRYLQVLLIGLSIFRLIQLAVSFAFIIVH